MKNLRKLAQMLHEVLPARQRVYFVYTHKNGYARFHHGLKANTEISYWSYTALRQNFPRVRFLRFQNEKPERIAKIRPQDIVIGHIGPTLNQACKYTKKIIFFGPWAGHEDRSRVAFNCAPKEFEMELYDRAAALVLLTSEHNVKEYLKKPTNFWFSYFQNSKKLKPVRVVHQPIDLDLFARIKREYGSDDFLYIGNDAHMKCVDHAQKLVNALGRQFFTYGFGGNKINHLNQNQVNGLVNKADFFLQPGMWEAQCVSILEAAARGFIPIVTPDTGYPYDHPYLLRFGDFDYNLKIVKKLLKTTASERKALADHLHSQLIQDAHHNSWKTLTNVLIEEVRKLS